MGRKIRTVLLAAAVLTLTGCAASANPIATVTVTAGAQGAPAASSSSTPSDAPSAQQPATRQGIGTGVVLPTVKPITKDMAWDKMGLAVWSMFIGWRDTGSATVSTTVADPKAGAKTAALQKADGIDADTFAQDLSNELENRYTEALFEKNWTYDSDLVQFAKTVNMENQEGTKLSILVANSKVGYSFPFDWQVKLEGIDVVNASNGQVNLLLTFQDGNDAGQFGEAQYTPDLLHINGEYQIAAMLNYDGTSMKLADLSLFESRGRVKGDASYNY